MDKSQKRYAYISKETYIHVSKESRYIQVYKEIYVYTYFMSLCCEHAAERTLHKRYGYMSKETYIHVWKEVYV